MGGKKKAAKKSKGSSGEEAGDDDSTERLYNLYRRKCTELSTTIPAKVREKFDDAIGEGLFLTEVPFFFLQAESSGKKGWRQPTKIAEHMGFNRLARCQSFRRRFTRP